MDEPTSGVASSDKMEVVEVLARALRGSGVTAVFVEHDMEVVARFADRVAVWGQGRITAVGPPDRVLNDPEVRREVIGLRPGEANHAAA
jgi:branched-chain amino acid transport system ATP-binding protein